MKAEITTSIRHIDSNTLFQSLDTPYIVFGVDDPDFTILEENAAHAKVAMVDRDKTVGRPLFDVFPDTSEEYVDTGRSELLESIRNVIRTGKSDRMPGVSYSIRDKTGTFEERYWDLTHYPVFGKSGKVIAVYQETRDISDRKEIAQALTESEARLRFMADSVPHLIWVTQPDGRYEYYNQRWYDFTGMTEGGADETWTHLIHPGDREHSKKAWRHSLKTGKPYEVEYRLFHASTKTYRWVIGRALPYRDETGEITKWYGTCTDVDQQKRAAQVQTFLGNVSKELGASLSYERLLRKITKVSVPSVADWCTVDLYDGENGFEQVSIAHVDPAKTKLAEEYREHNPVYMDQPTGLPAVMRTGKSEYYPYISTEMIEEALEDDDKRAFMLSLNLRSIIIAPLKVRDTVVGGISFVSSDSGRYYTKDDLAMIEELAARVSLALTNSRLYEEAQREIKTRQKLEHELLLEKQKLESRVKERTKQLILTNEGLRDEIIKRHTIERELQKKTESLEQSNRELEDFAYVASHDLQEPLRKIQAFSDLLLSEYSDRIGEGVDYVKRMESAASRMSTLIQDLLSFSRVTTRKNPKQKVDLQGIVEDVIVDLESRIEAVGGTVRVGELPTVIADPTHMRQLFQNLIGNALKFHKPDEKPVVELSSRIIGEYWEINVKDNGIGFDEKYIDKIFSVFQRLHGRDSYEGTGIGLAVCRKIVERYDGSITAVSKKDKGATFTVRLPRDSKEKRHR